MYLMYLRYACAPNGIWQMAAKRRYLMPRGSEPVIMDGQPQSPAWPKMQLEPGLFKSQNCLLATGWVGMYLNGRNMSLFSIAWGDVT